jgi:hypothetical protein
MSSSFEGLNEISKIYGIHICGPMPMVPVHHHVCGLEAGNVCVRTYHYFVVRKGGGNAKGKEQPKRPKRNSISKIRKPKMVLHSSRGHSTNIMPCKVHR